MTQVRIHVSEPPDPELLDRVAEAAEAFGCPVTTGWITGPGLRFLGAPGLDGALQVLRHTLGCRGPLGVALPPAAVTPHAADVLCGHRVHHVRLDVHTFDDRVARAAGLTQQGMTVQTALEALSTIPVPCREIRLSHGMAHQDPETWQVSLESALEWRPDRIAITAWPDSVDTGLADRATELLALCGYRPEGAAFALPDREAPVPIAPEAHRLPR